MSAPPCDVPGGTPSDFELRAGPGGAALHSRRHPQWRPLRVDWAAPALQDRIRAGRRQPLARATGLHRFPGLRVLDATAGLGRDGFVLAALGARVTMVERQPQLFRLLSDAQARARVHDSLAAAAARITLLAGDALDHLDAGHDVIYLDPMYDSPGRSALPRRDLQFLSGLCGSDPDAGALLAAARGRARQRVVVKRDRRAPVLDAASPDLALRTTQLRFDIYLRR